MKWYLESAVTAGLSAALVVIVLLVLNAGSKSTDKNKQIIIDLKEGEQVVGGSELRCDDLKFRAKEFNIGTKSGTITVDSGTCILVKTNANQ